MFSKLYNEAVITFEIRTLSPLFIKSGTEEGLNLTAADNTYLSVHKDGQVVPVIPGTSVKGVFRSRAEKILEGSCNPFSNNCGNKTRKLKTGVERYKQSCPICRIFGSTALKSRIQFSDLYPVGEYKIGKRTNVAIDRITGSAKPGALFEFEYVEYGIFKGEIKLTNFFRWQMKVITDILNDMNHGFVTFGGLTSKGFGRMELLDMHVKLRYYDKSKCSREYKDMGFYKERELSDYNFLNDLLKDVNFSKKEIERYDLNEQAI